MVEFKSFHMFLILMIPFTVDNVATPPPTRTTKLPTTTKRTTKLSSTSKRTTKVTKATTRPTTTKATRTTTRPTPPPPTTTDPAAGETSPNADLPAILIPVAVVSAALLIIIVAVIRWKGAKENNTQLDDNTADPPDGVSYASIRYKKKTKRKARVQGEDDMVTYSTLNTFSTSAGASTDPRRLYISINKTNT
ncbi:protein EVI2B-like [Amphiprion ocellaris]|uniref:protein EVI2B-like n=1 Tax=Amphiprion ocellaris TaxID=80972 RepID=UPI00241183C9|nr:protein EVI2B-like [Amphiprion ocellaris]